MPADCAEMRKLYKIGCFINFGEIGDKPNTFYFYFQHNRLTPVENFGNGTQGS